MENLLQELEAISPKPSPNTKEGFDFPDSPANQVVKSGSEDRPVTSPSTLDREEDTIPKIKNIYDYDELHPLPNDPPPKKPPRSQGSPPNKKRTPSVSQNGDSQVKKNDQVPPSANVSELDALLKTLGDNVNKTASVAQGMRI